MRVLLALLLLPALAHADPRVSMGVGGGGRFGNVDDVHFQGGDLHGELEVRFAGATSAVLVGDLAGASAIDTMVPVRGTAEVAALTVRDTLMGFGEPHHLGGDMFFDLGGGRERIGWSNGSALTRDFVSFGIGGSVVLPHGTHRIRYGFRIDLARAPDPGKLPPTCDGPCDQPTKTRPYDASILMEVTWNVGR
jgi:hypothetical protein